MIYSYLFFLFDRNVQTPPGQTVVKTITVMTIAVMETVVITKTTIDVAMPRVVTKEADDPGTRTSNVVAITIHTKTDQVVKLARAREKDSERKKRRSHLKRMRPKRMLVALQQN